jgi:hypothetical protein
MLKILARRFLPSAADMDHALKMLQAAAANLSYLVRVQRQIRRLFTSSRTDRNHSSNVDASTKDRVTKHFEKIGPFSGAATQVPIGPKRANFTQRALRNYERFAHATLAARRAGKTTEMPLPAAGGGDAEDPDYPENLREVDEIENSSSDDEVDLTAEAEPSDVDAV